MKIWRCSITEVCPNGTMKKVIWPILALRHRISSKSIWSISKCRIRNNCNQTVSYILRVWMIRILREPPPQCVCRKAGTPRWGFNQLFHFIFDGADLIHAAVIKRGGDGAARREWFRINHSVLAGIVWNYSHLAGAAPAWGLSIVRLSAESVSVANAVSESVLMTTQTVRMPLSNFFDIFTTNPSYYWVYADYL